MSTTKKSFSLGQIVSTPGVLADVPPGRMLDGIARHASGDWGTVCRADAAANDGMPGTITARMPSVCAANMR